MQDRASGGDDLLGMRMGLAQALDRCPLLAEDLRVLVTADRMARLRVDAA